MVALDERSEQSAFFPPPWLVESADHYDFQALADIYNDTRVDYIVPMPMNARRMEDYVRDYDVDLENSIIINDREHNAVGIGMLAMRDKRGWLTRLGVVPHLRKHKLGHLLMVELLERARTCGAKVVQLEVIVGNEPARRLFLKYGFQPTRELLVLNRPPSSLLVSEESLPAVTPLSKGDIDDCLRQVRREPASWLNESASFAKAGDVIGFKADAHDGETGWLICRKSRFQLSHFALDLPQGQGNALACALFTALHHAHPAQDAKFENLDSSSPAAQAMARLGYIEVFSRTEMHLRVI